MPEPVLRIDKWLWCARIVKTRALARELIASGHVRLNRRKVLKPGHDIRCGDVLTIAWSDHVYVWRVTAIPSRRGSASQARLIYEDLAAGSLR